MEYILKIFLLLALLSAPLSSVPPLVATSANQVESSPKQSISSETIVKDRGAKEGQIERYVLSSNEVIVRTFRELKRELETENNGKNVFYLGADIMLESGIVVPSSKVNIVIDGVDPDTLQQHVLRTNTGQSEGDVIQIGGVRTSKITLQKMNLVGRAQFGIVLVKDTIAGIEVIFSDVMYEGRRLATNPHGTIKIINSEMLSSLGPQEELGKVRNLIFEGRVILNHPVDKTAFLFTGVNPSIDIKENAVVEITAKESFNEGIAMPKYTQGKGSRVRITRTADVAKVFLITAGDFRMEQGAEIRIIQTMNSRGTIIQNSTQSSRLIMNGAKIIVENSATKLGSYLSFRQILMTNSEINIAIRGVVSAITINVSGSATLTDSKLNITATENVTTDLGVVVIAGKLMLTRSEVNTIIQKKVVNQVLNLGEVALIASEILVSAREGMTGTSRKEAVIMKIPSFASSNLIIEMGGESGVLYRVDGELVIQDESKIVLNAVKSKTGLFIGNRGLSISGGGTFIAETRESDTAEQLIKAAGTVQFRDNAIVHLINRKGRNKGLVSVSGLNSEFIIVNPKQVILFAPTLEGKLIYSDQNLILNFTAEQINQWEEASTFEQTGTLMRIPEYEYTKKRDLDMIIMVLSRAGDAGVSEVVGTNFEPEDGDSPERDFSIHRDRTKVLSLGRLDNTVTRPRYDDVTVVGQTDAQANIWYQYYSEDTLYTSTGVAGQTGSYTLPIRRVDDRRSEMRTNIPYLYDTKVITPERLPGELKLLEVPKTMTFGTQLIPTKQTDLPRIEKVWAMKIEDTRDRRSNWKLFATKKTDLIPSDNTKPAIKNPFSFVDGNGDKHILGVTAVEIRTTKNGPTLSTISWAETEGVLLTINPGNVYSNIEYTGTIQWSVQDAP
ncbi:MAG: hypothetical protein ACRC6X_04715 [Culicoidibacterales bacterium]